MRPLFMQLVHIRMVFGCPFSTQWTFFRLGSHLVRVLLFAWLTLFPSWGFLPHISQALAIFLSPYTGNLDRTSASRGIWKTDINI